MTEFEKQALQFLKAIREEVHELRALLSQDITGADPDPACPNCGSTHLEDTTDMASPNQRVTCLNCGTSTHTPRQEAVSHG